MELPGRPNLHVRDLCAFLEISRSKVYQMIARGEIPSKRIGGAIRIPRQAFVEWYESLWSADS